MSVARHLRRCGMQAPEKVVAKLLARICPLLFPFVCYADQGKELKVIKSRLKEILFLAITAYEETNPLKQTKL